MSDLTRAIARGVSQKAAVKRSTEAANALVRMSGEVVTIGSVCERTGFSLAKVRRLYRNGARTWEAMR